MSRTFAALMALASVALPVAVSASEDSPVTVRQERGVYHVAAAFTVPQPPAAALAALTDYAEIPRFMPDVRVSRVLESGADRAVVEQEAVAKFMLFSKRIHLVLEVRKEGTAVRFRDRCGRSFERYEGTWTVAERDGLTEVTYQLSAKPSFEVPEFLLKRLLKRDARQMIERLEAEIGRRNP